MEFFPAVSFALSIFSVLLVNASSKLQERKSHWLIRVESTPNISDWIYFFPSSLFFALATP